MILDATLLFSDAQAVTADAASTNIIDFGAPGTSFSGQTQTRDLGPGTPLYVHASVDVSFATIVSMNIILQTATSSGFGSPIVVWTSRLFLLAEMVAGFRFELPPVYGSQILRYLRLYYDVNTSATAGSITAGLTLVPQRNPTG